jgi:hypothetical protein
VSEHVEYTHSQPTSHWHCKSATITTASSNPQLGAHFIKRECQLNVDDVGDVAISFLSSIGSLWFRVIFSASEVGRRGVEEQSSKEQHAELYWRNLLLEKCGHGIPPLWVNAVESFRLERANLARCMGECWHPTCFSSSPCKPQPPMAEIYDVISRHSTACGIIATFPEYMTMNAMPTGRHRAASAWPMRRPGKTC